MRWKLLLVLLPAVALMVAVGLRTPRQNKATGSQPTTSSTPAQTIAVTGEILGVKIGMAMTEVRTKLDPKRAAGQTYQPDEKELKGRRIYWKLSDTDYEWIMVWAGKQGNVTRVRAMFRPEHRKPFAEIGDIRQAVTTDAAMVRWNLQGANGSRYRLVAQGTGQQAISVYMFSLDIPPEDQVQEGDAHLEVK